MTFTSFLIGVLMGVVLRPALPGGRPPRPTVEFADAGSASIWERLAGSDDLVLVPMPPTTAAARSRRLDWISTARRSSAVFLHVGTRPRPSRAGPMQITIRAEHEGFVISADRAVTVADAITWIGVELGVREIVMGCPERPIGWFASPDVGAAVADRLAGFRRDRIALRRRAAARFAREQHRTEGDPLLQLAIAGGALLDCFPALNQRLRPLPSITWVA